MEESPEKTRPKFELKADSRADCETDDVVWDASVLNNLVEREAQYQPNPFMFQRS